MGLKIIISSAVELKEKDEVILKLREMHDSQIINIDDIYDCNQTATPISGGNMGASKQIEINEDVIKNVDWFICLASEATVGENTANELYFVANQVKSGRNIVITVMHDKDKNNYTSIGEGRVSVEEMRKKVSDELECGNHYFCSYKFSEDYVTLKDAIEKEYKNLYREKRFYCQHIDYYTKIGNGIKPKELYYDSNRAENKNGFIDSFYIRRFSVDDLFQDYIENRMGSFLFLTGAPGSGKTRTIYELLKNGILKDEKVIIIREENAIDIANALIVSRNNRSNTILLDANFAETNYYFVCDQVTDVLLKMRKELLGEFFRVINECNNCMFIGTNLASNLEMHLKDFPIIDRSESGNCHIVNIKPISEEYNSERIFIIEKLKEKFPISEGETIGDFIPELNNYKQNIKNRILDKILKRDCNKEPKSYLKELLHAIQLVVTFRKTRPLFLVVMLMRYKLQSDSDYIFAEKCSKAINYLIVNNVLWIYDSIKMRKMMNIEEGIFDFSTKEEYDGEKFENNIIPVKYEFTINDLIWGELQKEEDRNFRNTNYWEHLFYDMSDEDGLGIAIKDFYNTFPTANSLGRILPRIPLPKLELMNRVHKFVYDKLENTQIDNRNLRDVQYVYGLLIGRCNSIEEVENIKNRMIDCNIPIDDNVIAEMYLFASKRLKSNYRNNDFIDFIKQVKSIDEGNISQPTLETIYKESYIVRLFYNNFNSAYKYVIALFDRIGWITIKTAIKNNTHRRSNVEKLVYSLALLCEDMGHIKLLIELYQKLEIEPTTKVSYVLAGIVKNEKYYRDELLSLITENKEFIGKTHLYEMFICSMIITSVCFENAKKLYEAYEQKTNIIKPNIKLISLTLNSCKPDEFQSVVSFLKKKLGDVPNHIIMNKMILKAPGYDDALYYVNKLDYRQNYTLGSFLKNLDKKIIGDNKQREGFIRVYELINHPHVESIRTDTRIVYWLYKFAQNEWHERYIDKLLGGKSNDVLTNESLCTTIILKPYKTFEESYIFFKKAYKAQKAKLIYGRIKSDIFNAILNKYEKEKDKEKIDEGSLMNIYEIIDEHLDSDSIIIDENLLFNYFIKTNKLDIFNNECTELLLQFEDYIYKRKGEANFYNKNIWSKLIKYFAERQDDNYSKKCRLLYDFYMKLYKENKLHLLYPDSKIYESLLTCVETEEDASFIDNEMIRFNIEYTKIIGEEILKISQCINYKFKHKSSRRLNYHKQSIDIIGKAKKAEDIINVLETEYERYGILLPSMLADAIYRLYEMTKNKRCNNAYKDIKILVEKYKLSEMLTARAWACLVTMAPNIKEKIICLECFDKLPEISEPALGMLAVETQLAQFDLNRSRKYFIQWKGIYEDIYPDKNIMIMNIPHDKYFTIKRHLKWDYAYRDYAKARIPNEIALLDNNERINSEVVSLLLNCYDDYLETICYDSKSDNIHVS